VTEECDDGNLANAGDSCSNDCRVRDVLVLPSPANDSGLPSFVHRQLGTGAHTVGAGPHGFAVAFNRTSSDPNELAVRAFSASGAPGKVVTLSNQSGTLDTANPVVAALPTGEFAVAYTDLNQDGSGRGIALRIVDPVAGTAGPVIRVNQATYLNQQDADLIWTGSQLVAAWTDQSGLAQTKADVKVRVLGSNGSGGGGEQTIANTTAQEADVTLAPFNGSWAIAYREGTTTQKRIVVKAGTTTWDTPLGDTPALDEQPVLVELDSTHLLLAFTEDGGSGGGHPRVRLAVLDTASPGTVTSADLAAMVEPYASDATIGQREPTLARVGDRIFLVWRSLSPASASLIQDELWLKELSWKLEPGGWTLDVSSQEVPLPREDSHVKGVQRRPSIVATPLLPGGALVAVWDDDGRGFGAIQGTVDVVAELIPVPIVRLPEDGGLGK
jgi:hypothetical protein